MPRCRPKPETQDGGCQTGSSCISRSLLDGVEIPKQDTTIFGLAAAILCFRSRSMSEGVGESDDLVDPENLCVGFEISTLSSIERVLQLIPVWWHVIQRFRCRSMSKGVDQ
jgi:hypothetical protein